MSCYLCGNSETEQVKGVVRDMPELKILKCSNCGLTYLENFNHIDDNYYEKSNMNDFGSLKDYIESCIDNDNWRINKYKDVLRKRNVLDFGCGLGGFVKGMQEYCKIDGCDIDPLWKQVNPNIDVYSNLEEVPDNYYDIITMFHVLEHLKDPKAILKKVSEKLNNKGHMFIEVPNANDALLSLYDCEAFQKHTYWSCHLYLFDNCTLKQLINDVELKVNFIMQFQRYPLANHLYWLSHGKSGGHNVWNSFFNKLNKDYELALAELGCADTIIASVSK